MVYEKLRKVDKSANPKIAEKLEEEMAEISNRFIQPKDIESVR